MTGLEFAAVALIGVLIGRFLPNRRKGPKPVQPVCGDGGATVVSFELGAGVEVDGRCRHLWSDRSGRRGDGRASARARRFPPGCGARPGYRGRVATRS